MVQFNVGGTVINLSEQALGNHPNSRFSILFTRSNNPSSPVPKDESGAIVIDHDPSFIKLILKYMENDVGVPTRLFAHSLSEDARYFGLLEYAMDLEEMTNVKEQFPRFDGVYWMFADMMKTAWIYKFVFSTEKTVAIFGLSQKGTNVTQEYQVFGGVVSFKFGNSSPLSCEMSSYGDKKIIAIEQYSYSLVSEVCFINTTESLQLQTPQTNQNWRQWGAREP